MRRASVRDWLMSLIYLTAILVAYFAVPIDRSQPTGSFILAIAITLAAVVVMFGIISRSVRTRIAEGQTSFRIVDVVLVIEFITLAFAFVYFVLGTEAPGQIDGITTRIDALYFTVSTMATVGFGDIHATGQLARVLTTLQIAFDVVFIAVVARLLSHRVDEVRAARQAELRKRSDEGPVA